MDEINVFCKKWPSLKQKQSLAAGLQDPLEQATFRPDRSCRECGSPFNFNHHESCWTGKLELRVDRVIDIQLLLEKE